MTEHKDYHVAVVGATGAVGQQMIETLEKRDLPIKTIIFIIFCSFCWKKFTFKGEDNYSCRKQNQKALKESILLYLVQEAAFQRNLLLKQ